MTRFGRHIKTLFDLSSAILIATLCAQLFCWAVLIIKLFSRGPILFTQERIGLNGQPFNIYKFRTMTVDTDRTLTGTVTIRDDPRVFFGAGFLRKSKIDELPQVINIFNSTMSLVGPRPTVDDDYQRMTDTQKRRFQVRPGLTGLAQVNGNTSLNWPERIEYDLRYIDEHSLAVDIMILLKTVILVLTIRADTHPQQDDEWAETETQSESTQEIRRAA
jgi:lipopolysaccharide/colanic/teichoic acid biosynthesis glycosyltransferase